MPRHCALEVSLQGGQKCGKADTSSHKPLAPNLILGIHQNKDQEATGLHVSNPQNLWGRFDPERRVEIIMAEQVHMWRCWSVLLAE